MIASYVFECGCVGNTASVGKTCPFHGKELESPVDAAARRTTRDELWRTVQRTCLEIVLDDDGPADVEHIIVAALIRDSAISLDHANALGLRFQRTAKFRWVAGEEDSE